jgi:hypothetical protein
VPAQHERQQIATQRPKGHALATEDNDGLPVVSAVSDLTRHANPSFSVYRLASMASADNAPVSNLASA